MKGGGYIQGTFEITAILPDSFTIKSSKVEIMRHLMGKIYDAIKATMSLTKTRKLFHDDKLVEETQSKVLWQDPSDNIKYTPWECNLDPLREQHAFGMTPILLPDNSESLDTCKVKARRVGGWVLCPKAGKKICEYFCPDIKNPENSKAVPANKPPNPDTCKSLGEEYSPRTRNGVIKLNGLEHINAVYLGLEKKKKRAHSCSKC